MSVSGVRYLLYLLYSLSRLSRSVALAELCLTVPPVWLPVWAAREQASLRAEAAQEQALPRVEVAPEQASLQVEAAREQVVPRVEAVREPASRFLSLVDWEQHVALQALAVELPAQVWLPVSPRVLPGLERRLAVAPQPEPGPACDTRSAADAPRQAPPDAPDSRARIERD